MEFDRQSPKLPKAVSGQLEVSSKAVCIGGGGILCGDGCVLGSNPASLGVQQSWVDGLTIL